MDKRIFGNKEKETIDPLISMLMSITDKIIDNGHINEDGIAFVKLTLDIIKMDAQRKNDMDKLVFDSIEKMRSDCKDKSIKDIENIIIEMLISQEQNLKYGHDKIIAGYDKMLETLEMEVRKRDKTEKNK